MTECITIGPVELWHGNALDVFDALAARGDRFDCLLTDSPYSSGGAFRGDRMGATSMKYQNGENAGIYPEFAGDNRDQRAYGYWSTLWMLCFS